MNKIEKAQKTVKRLEHKDELTEKETQAYNAAMDVLIENGYYHF